MDMRCPPNTQKHFKEYFEMKCGLKYLRGILKRWEFSLI
jgi:hypothetical protein